MSKLIVIEGLDGCGKTTQFKLLQQNLTAEGVKHKAISYPDYRNKSSYLVKRYLSGKMRSITPYTASLYYAVDRSANYSKWEKDYLEGTPIIACRYTTSNILYQMSKLAREEWEGYINWLEDTEYNKMGLPKQDKVIVLDMPIEVSQKLLTQRYTGDESKKDIHEKDIEYLYKCREAVMYAKQNLGWEILSCCDENNNIYSKEIIQEQLLNKIKEVIGEG